MCFGCSFEYPQHMLWMRNKKKNYSLSTLIWRPLGIVSYYPCLPANFLKCDKYRVRSMPVSLWIFTKHFCLNFTILFNHDTYTFYCIIHLLFHCSDFHWTTPPSPQNQLYSHKVVPLENIRSYITLLISTNLLNTTYSYHTNITNNKPLSCTSTH